jgi:hexosaminidase
MKNQPIPALIPQPATLRLSRKVFDLATPLAVTTNSTRSELTFTTTWLQHELNRVCGTPAKRRTHGTVAIEWMPEPDAVLGAEGYRLTVAEHGVTIAANTPAGCFYGAQTLLQLLPATPTDTVSLPGMTITDYPRFAWRGLMLDVSRHFFTVDEVKAYIDQLARYKMNVFHWHLTDDQGWRLPVAKQPRLTEVGAWRVPRLGNWWQFEPPQPGEKSTYGGFYTPEQIKEVVAYARERFVTVVPEVDVPGHSMAALAAYPELSCLGGPFQVNPGCTFYGEIENALCPGKEATYAFLENVFAAVAELFPGTYIHMGGDEAFKGFWQKCPDCQALMAREHLANADELQSYFVKRVEKIIERHGKRLIGWDEILEGGLAPNATVMSWRGIAGGVAAAKAQHDVVMSPAPFYYLDLYQGDPVIEPMTYALARLKTAYEFEPVPADVDPKRILGVQGNLWTEAVVEFRHAQYMTWPRGWAIAETGWSPSAAKNWPDFARRTEEHMTRSEALGVNVARSMFDPIITTGKDAAGTLTIEMATEIEGLTIHYTFSGANPDGHYPHYHEPLTVPKNAATLKVITCRDGNIVGRHMTVPLAELEKRAAGH